ncbi:hypothetical protein, partial [Desulforamulus aquiferis]
SYLINKILDDIGLYERFKEYLLNVSEVSSSGKEANITVISPTVTEEKKRRVRLKVVGKDDKEIAENLDNLRKHREFINEEISKFEREYENLQEISYVIQKKEGITEIRKVSEKSLGNNVDYYE